jgi:uncharacterized membrane protein
MRLAGHPVHPMLVHFPIVFWSCAVAADVVGLFTHAALAAELGFGTLALGFVTGLLAMIAGVLDFMDLSKDSPARDTAVMHLIVMCSAWLIFLVALALRGFPPNAPVPTAALIASATGFLAMVYGAWQGGRLVYEFGVGAKTQQRRHT